jgi:hypothetical protein
VADAGYYLVSYSVGADLPSGTRSGMTAYVQQKPSAGSYATVHGSKSYSYGRTAGDYSATSAASFVVQVAAGDKFKLMALGTSLSLATQADAVSFSIVQLKGLKGDTGATGATGAAGTSGIVVQQVRTQTGTYATGTTVIPNDTTIPQNTEGNQYMSLAITPTSSSNILVIEITANLSASVLAGLTMALFQDSTANALAAQVVTIGAAGWSNTIALKYYMTAGTTSSTTFKMRAGINTAGSTYFNVQSGMFGGITMSNMIITELTP